MVQIDSKFGNSTLPAPLCERYSSADGPSLRVALFLVINGASEPEKISEKLNIPLYLVEEALRFWRACGLTADKKNDVMVESFARILRDEDIAILLQETQIFLGRPIDVKESRRLTDTVAEYNITTDVLLLALSYSMGNLPANTNLISYACRTAIDWNSNGVYDIASAEQYVRNLEKIDEFASKVCDMLDIPKEKLTRKNRENLDIWLNVYGYDEEFVKEAYIRFGKNSINYINSVLTSWYKNGYRTIKDTRKSTSNVKASGRSSSKRDVSLLKQAIESEED